MNTAKIVEGCSGQGEDRAEAFEKGSAVVCVVADGAGGGAGGRQAAEHICGQQNAASPSPTVRAAACRRGVVFSTIAR